MSELIEVRGVSNRDFLETHAAAGRIGLVGGSSLIDRLISRAERHLSPEGSWSCWTHAFLFQGRRADGEHWVIESDLELHRRHVRLGVQENRASKYHSTDEYPNLAVIDFGLNDEQVTRVLASALGLVADRTRYSLREILGSLLALRSHVPRDDKNPLEQDHSFFCSALVRHIFQSADIDLFPGVAVKHTTPEELSRPPLAHTQWRVQRHTPEPLVKTVVETVRHRVAVGRRARALKAAARKPRTA